MVITDTAATYLGIHIENEFYSHHYPSEVFQWDIRATLQAWAERESRAREEGEAWRAPYTRLRQLARSYFTLRERLRRERSV